MRLKSLESVTIVETWVSVTHVHVCVFVIETILHTCFTKRAKYLTCLLDHDRRVDGQFAEHATIKQRVPTRSPHEVVGIAVTSIVVEMDDRVVRLVLGWRQICLGNEQSHRSSALSGVVFHQRDHLEHLLVLSTFQDGVAFPVFDLSFWTDDVFWEPWNNIPTFHAVLTPPKDHLSKTKF